MGICATKNKNELKKPELTRSSVYIEKIKEPPTTIKEETPKNKTVEKIQTQIYKEESLIDCYPIEINFLFPPNEYFEDFLYEIKASISYNIPVKKYSNIHEYSNYLDEIKSSPSKSYCFILLIIKEDLAKSLQKYNFFNISSRISKIIIYKDTQGENFNNKEVILKNNKEKFGSSNNLVISQFSENLNCKFSLLDDSHDNIIIKIIEEIQILKCFFERKNSDFLAQFNNNKKLENILNLNNQYEDYLFYEVMFNLSNEEKLNDKQSKSELFKFFRENINKLIMQEEIYDKSKKNTVNPMEKRQISKKGFRLPTNTDIHEERNKILDNLYSNFFSLDYNQIKSIDPNNAEELNERILKIKGDNIERRFSISCEDSDKIKFGYGSSQNNTSKDLDNILLNNMLSINQQESYNVNKISHRAISPINRPKAFENNTSTKKKSFKRDFFDNNQSLTGLEEDFEDDVESVHSKNQKMLEKNKNNFRKMFFNDLYNNEKETIKNDEDEDILNRLKYREEAEENKNEINPPKDTKNKADKVYKVAGKEKELLNEDLNNLVNNKFLSNKKNTKTDLILINPNTVKKTQTKKTMPLVDIKNFSEDKNKYIFFLAESLDVFKTNPLYNNFLTKIVPDFYSNSNFMKLKSNFIEVQKTRCFVQNDFKLIVLPEKIEPFINTYFLADKLLPGDLYDFKEENKECTEESLCKNEKVIEMYLKNNLFCNFINKNLCNFTSFRKIEEMKVNKRFKNSNIGYDETKYIDKKQKKLLISSENNQTENNINNNQNFFTVYNSPDRNKNYLTLLNTMGDEDLKPNQTKAFYNSKNSIKGMKEDKSSFFDPPRLNAINNNLNYNIEPEEDENKNTPENIIIQKIPKEKISLNYNKIFKLRSFIKYILPDFKTGEDKFELNDSNSSSENDDKSVSKGNEYKSALRKNYSKMNLHKKTDDYFGNDYNLESTDKKNFKNLKSTKFKNIFNNMINNNMSDKNIRKANIFYKNIIDDKNKILLPKRLYRGIVADTKVLETLKGYIDKPILTKGIFSLYEDYKFVLYMLKNKFYNFSEIYNKNYQEFLINHKIYNNDLYKKYRFNKRDKDTDFSSKYEIKTDESYDYDEVKIMFIFKPKNMLNIRENLLFVNEFSGMETLPREYLVNINTLFQIKSIECKNNIYEVVCNFCDIDQCLKTFKDNKNLQYLSCINYHQTAEKESKLLDNIINLNFKLDSFYLANILYKMRKYELAIFALENINIEEFDLSESKNEIEFQKQSLLGIIFDDKGDYRQALSCHSKAIKISMEIFSKSHKNTAECLNNIGNTYENLGDYEKSLIYFNNSLNIYKGLGKEFSTEKACCYISIGNIYNYLKDYDNSLVYLHKGLKKCQKHLSELNSTTASVFNSLGVTLMNKRDFPEAIKNFKTSLKIYRNLYIDDNPCVASIYVNLGNINDDEENYQEAKKNYEKGVEIFTAIYGMDHPDTAGANNNLGVVYKKLTEYSNAIDNFKKSYMYFSKAYGNKHPFAIKIMKNIEDTSVLIKRKVKDKPI